MYLKLFSTIMTVCAFSLSGSLEHHFKGAPGKQPFVGVRNVDFAYMINLDQRPEKFEYCMRQFREHGIEPYRFSAVNGWELTGAVINQLGVDYDEGMREGLLGTYFTLDGNAVDEIVAEAGRSYFCHKMTKGAIGIVMSHLSILQDAYDSGYETIWVMEDDIQLIQDPHLLSDLIERLDALVGHDGWDILFTDRDTKGRDGNYVICRSCAARPNFTPAQPEKYGQEPTAVSDDFNQIYARYGAYSMIVRRSGIEKLLQFFKSYKVFLPYDMDFYLPEGIRLFCLRDDVVSTKPDALSDNGKPGYHQPR